MRYLLPTIRKARIRHSLSRQTTYLMDGFIAMRAGRHPETFDRLIRSRVLYEATRDPRDAGARFDAIERFAGMNRGDQDVALQGAEIEGRPAEIVRAIVHGTYAGDHRADGDAIVHAAEALRIHFRSARAA